MRITFNKPATEQFFRAEEAEGVRVQIDNGKVQFLPVSGSDTQADDVLPVVPRSRGGAEAKIEGSMADALATAMRNEHGVFFVLERLKGGWLAPRPHPNAEPPPKFVPHIRIWSGVDEEVEAPKVQRHATEAAPNPEIVVALEKVRGARDLIDRYSGERRPGRPPREVLEARATLAAFEGVAAEVLPAFKNLQIAVSRLDEASSIMTRILSDVPGPIVVPNEIMAAARVARAPAEAPAPQNGADLPQSGELAAPPTLRRGRGEGQAGCQDEQAEARGQGGEGEGEGPEGGQAAEGQARGRGRGRPCGPADGDAGRSATGSAHPHP
jgi:hypothetical protein